MLLDLLALGILGAAIAGFFWRILFAGEWMPAGGGDLASFLYPSYHFTAETLKTGTIPFWNPYLWGGAPFVADIQSSVFYPVNLIFFLLSPKVTYRGMMCLAVFHFWLAGAGMYLCTKYALLPNRLSTASSAPLGEQAVGASHWTATIASLFAAIAFMFSDFFIVHFGNVNLIAQAAWLPLVFLFFHRALRKQRLVLAVWAGVFLATAATAGHLQPLLFMLLLLALDALFHMGIKAWRSHSAKPRTANDIIQPTYTLLVTTVLGLGMAAFVLLPAYSMSQSTARAEISYSQASQYSLAPAQLIGLLVPNFFGRDPAVVWGGWDRVEIGYLGILPLLMAVFALLMKRDRQTGFLSVLTLISLTIAMGSYAFLHGWLYQFVPGLSGLRAPARIVFVFDFAVAGLAAFGLYYLLVERENARSALRRMLRPALLVLGAVVLFVLPLSYYALITNQDKDPVLYARTAAAVNGVVFFAILLCAGILLLAVRYRRRMSPLLFGAAAVGLLFVDLASLGSGVDVGREDPTRTFDHPGIVEFLKADTSLYRIDTRTDVWHLWQPDTGLLYGISDVAGVVNPLTLVDYERFLNSLPDRTSPLYDFLNTKYVIAAKEVVLDWDKFVPVFDEDPQLNVYLNLKALPRAILVHDLVVVPSHEAAFEALHNPDFDPQTMAIVEGGVEQPKSENTGQASVQLSGYSPNKIDLQVETANPGYLILSEVWHPGWTATVDDIPVPLLRANYAFRTVALDPGSHRVSMVFLPPQWRTGITISIISGLVTVVWLLVSTRRCKKGASQVGSQTNM